MAHRIDGSTKEARKFAGYPEELRSRKAPQKEKWRRKCRLCDNFIPDDYVVCGWCLAWALELERTHDTLDHYGHETLYTEESVMRALRALLGEVYVRGF